LRGLFQTNLPWMTVCVPRNTGVRKICSPLNI
jgi:hypothetical protein